MGVSPGPIEDGGDLSTTIVDYPGVFPAQAMAQAWATNLSQEDDNGHTKTITVAGKYRGVEEVHKAEGEKLCKWTFGVSTRFIITIEAQGVTDAKLVPQCVGAMRLDQLAAEKGE